MELNVMHKLIARIGHLCLQQVSDQLLSMVIIHCLCYCRVKRRLFFLDGSSWGDKLWNFIDFNEFNMLVSIFCRCNAHPSNHQNNNNCQSEPNFLKLFGSIARFKLNRVAKIYLFIFTRKRKLI